MPNIFISHSHQDSETATALERVVRGSFPGAVEVFHTGRPVTGLAAGQSIDEGLISRIRETDAFIWLATPASVKASFWMAWELGVASAQHDCPIVPVRCFGLEPGALPLLQGGRNALDLGRLDDLRAFLLSLKALLHREDDLISEATADWEGVRTPFWGSANNDALVIRALGNRLLVENKMDYPMRVLHASVDSFEGAALPGLVAGTQIQPRERRIFESEEIESLTPSTSASIEWDSPAEGRFFATIELRGW